MRISWVADVTRNDASDASFVVQPAALKSVTFAATTATITNPERGFFTSTDLNRTTYNNVRTAGNTLSRPFYRMDAYRNTVLPQSFLDQVTAAFQKARNAGIKLVPRFNYNNGPYPNSDPDAPLSIILQHIQQLTPILRANADVILAVEAGFIGAWGEWHTSTNGLDTDPAAKATVLSALLDALPASRMVELRYPSDMRLLNGDPISLAEAFSGTNRARVGSHNDCFLASDTDQGTYWRDGSSVDTDKAYVAANSQFAIQGGETCAPNPPRSDCPTALAELAQMHWTYLNADYEPTVLQGFKTQGCYDEINRRLGYRFRLVTGTYAASVQRGQTFQFNLQVANDGFAAMVNARPVYAVLSQGTERYTCQITADPRTWAAGSTTTIGQTCALPSGMTPGTYTWSLWMPDAAASLSANPNYAVRLANQITWDATLGYNVLATDVVVAP